MPTRDGTPAPPRVRSRLRTTRLSAASEAAWIEYPVAFLAVAPWRHLPDFIDMAYRSLAARSRAEDAMSYADASHRPANEMASRGSPRRHRSIVPRCSRCPSSRPGPVAFVPYHPKLDTFRAEFLRGRGLLASCPARGIRLNPQRSHPRSRETHRVDLNRWIVQFAGAARRKMLSSGMPYSHRIVPGYPHAWARMMVSGAMCGSTAR